MNYLKNKKIKIKIELNIKNKTFELLKKNLELKNKEIIYMMFL